MQPQKYLGWKVDEPPILDNIVTDQSNTLSDDKDLNVRTDRQFSIKMVRLLVSSTFSSNL